MNKKIVAIVGDAVIEPDSLKYRLAYETGKALVDHGYRVQSGGLNGVMAAAFQGAKDSKNYQNGDTIAILPSFNRKEVNEYADIVIPTGLDLMRNVIVASADAVIAIGGGAGTMSEICNAWAMMRMCISFTNVEGWSQKIGGQPVDHRVRYDFEDKVFAVTKAAEAVKLLDEKLPLYTKVYGGIRPQDEDHNTIQVPHHSKR